jgi:cysteine desulfurase family protein (TIGR01976 family)
LQSQPFDVDSLRKQFPALNLRSDGVLPVFFDNPGGTQVPQRVIDAVTDYYRFSNANVGGGFDTSTRTDETIARARTLAAAFLNALGPENIVFGPNMTSLTFHLARSIGETIQPGDEVLVTNLDHDANVAPWLDLEARGARVRSVPIDPRDCTLSVEAIQHAITERTRLVAVTHASNAVGTIPDVAEIIRLAHAVGALVFVDAVQYAPHGPIDVQALDCDFLACSPYKFFGPHMGILYGKREHLERLKPHKVRPAKDTIPTRWETGTQNHEGIAGVAAALDYLADIGDRFGGEWQGEVFTAGFTGDRLRLKCAMHAIRAYELTLTERLIGGLQAVDELKIYGITDPARFAERLPVVAFTWPWDFPRGTAQLLAERQIYCWSGNYYALHIMEQLGLNEAGGAVRLGLAHYNTIAEIDRVVETLSAEAH